MRMMGKKALCLILALVMVVGLALTRDVAQAAGGTETIKFYWHHYDTGKGFYNPNDEGKDVSFDFIIEFIGTGADGKRHSGLYTQMTYSGKIGEETNIPVSLDEVKDQKGNSYTDCEIDTIWVVPYIKNTKYGASKGGKAGKWNYLLCQNMETTTQASIEEGAIVLDQDKNNMPIRYTVKKTEKIDGQEVTSPVKNNANEEIASTIAFKEGTVNVWEYAGESSAIHYSIFQNSLNPFSPYTGRYRTLHLIAEFTGDRKAELDERYELKMEGNDLDGWTLTLSSKIREGVKEDVEEIPYRTVYEFDPTMKEGEIKLKQEGRPGQKVTKTPYYYLPGEDGSEKLLKTLDDQATTTVTEPVDAIYLRGPVGPGSEVDPQPSDPSVDRIGGDDRVDTANKVSGKFYDNADTVILARKDDYPDALTAGVLSKLMNAPILLTETDQLDARAASEMKRLGAKEVIVIGGDSAISEKTFNQAKAIAGSAKRIGGHDRYETAALIANEVGGLTKNTSKAVIATGQDFADALAISSYAAKEGRPILLVKTNQIPEATSKALDDLKVEGVTIVGGDAAVSKSLEGKLPKLEARVGGANRYETAALIASRFFEKSDRAFLASGQKFADALVIGPVAGKLNAPVLLSKRDLLPAETKAQIKKASYKQITIVGLDGAISKAVEDELK